MIELGSYWSYYSLWFNKSIDNAVNYCCEPDPENIALGKRNAAINNCKNVHFIDAAAGSEDGMIINFTPQEGFKDDVAVPIRSVDGLADEFNIQNLDVLHMDVQGVELDALKSAESMIKAGKVRFIFISTHHFSISGDPLLHEKCLDKIKELGGHIIVEHAIHESFSGDGLIVASFSTQDKDLHIEVTNNRMENSIFRPYTFDLSILLEAYEKLRRTHRA